jgi:hypothetical protein
MASPYLLSVGITISFFVVLIAPSASAQSLADRRAAADAALADSRRSFNQSISRFYRNIDMPSPLKPSENTDFTLNRGGGTLKAAPAMSEAELKVFKAKQDEWEARCRPTVVEDSEGIRRAQYAQGDCDLSSYNTAGGR